MDRTSMRVAVILLLLVGFVALAFLASMVGGIAIRTVGQSEAVPVIDVSDVLVPGLPQLRVSLTQLGLTGDDGRVGIAVRTSDATVAIDRSYLDFTSGGDVVVTLPCETPSGMATVVVLFTDTGEVLAHSADVVILPQGPDCALQSN